MAYTVAPDGPPSNFNAVAGDIWVTSRARQYSGGVWIALEASPVVAAGSASSITFTVPPASMVRFVGNIQSQKAATTDNVILTVNGDSGSHYAQEYILANSATLTCVAGGLASPTSNNAGICYAASTAAFSGIDATIIFPGLAQTHTIMCESQTPAGGVTELLRTANHYSQAAAITTIAFTLGTGPFVNGSAIQMIVCP